MSKYQFRPATLDDIEQLKSFEQAVISAERPFNSAIKANGAYYYDLDELIASDNSLLLILEDDGNSIATGYVKIEKSKPSFQHSYHGYLGFMYVLPEYRGQGLNKLMINELISWAQNKDVQDFYLDVYSGNQAAINAYQKLGFQSSMIEMKLHK